MDTDQLDVSRQQTDTSIYGLSVEDASALFIQAGVPRSPRTVIRYCANKHLDCVKVDTERNEKYLVSETSVRSRIDELRQIMVTSHVAPRPVISGYGESRPDVSRPDETYGEKVQELEKEVATLKTERDRLELEKRDLEITNRVKDSILKKAEGELGWARDRLMRFNRAVGELTTILRLKAPEHDTGGIIHYLDAADEGARRQDENFVDGYNRNMG
jgi:hypothetical protein